MSRCRSRLFSARLLRIKEMNRHVDGLVRASAMAISSDEIAELEALADVANVNTRGWWEQEM